MDVHVEWEEIAKRSTVIAVPEDADSASITEASDKAARDMSQGIVLSTRWRTEDGKRFGGRVR